MKERSLIRRGYDLGSIPKDATNRNHPARIETWRHGKPILMEAVIRRQCESHASSIENSAILYENLASKIQFDTILQTSPYAERLEPGFTGYGSTFNEGSNQEIETVEFDAVDNQKVVAENFWIKVSWLSFHLKDQSLRFRFSFGLDFEEDVSADPLRQKYASLLCDAVFPESEVLCNNELLNASLCALLETDKVRFVERIVYFNAQHGGAYLHHDRERGHAGVVYAQLSGTTYWLALPKHQLTALIHSFVTECQNTNSWPHSISIKDKAALTLLVKDIKRLTDELESFANDELIHLINESKEFVQYLIAQGHGYKVNAGDVLLMPQESEDTCCWHSVFSLGSKAGQALSFAIRAD